MVSKFTGGAGQAFVFLQCEFSGGLCQTGFQCRIKKIST